MNSLALNFVAPWPSACRGVLCEFYPLGRGGRNASWGKGARGRGRREAVVPPGGRLGLDFFATENGGQSAGMLADRTHTLLTEFHLQVSWN